MRLVGIIPRHAHSNDERTGRTPTQPAPAAHSSWRRSAQAVGCAGRPVRPSRGARRQEKKYTKERVGYRDERTMGAPVPCAMLYAGDGDCAIVEGIVSRNGWCTQWTLRPWVRIPRASPDPPSCRSKTPGARRPGFLRARRFERMSEGCVERVAFVVVIAVISSAQRRWRYSM